MKSEEIRRNQKNQGISTSGKNLCTMGKKFNSYEYFLFFISANLQYFQLGLYVALWVVGYLVGTVEMFTSQIKCLDSMSKLKKSMSSLFILDILDLLESLE
jgi:hypothetical protein